MASARVPVDPATLTVRPLSADTWDAFAALVFDGDVAVAWCEYGSCEELPNIYHRKQYDEEADLRPDYRLTCLFVDKRYRRSGVSVASGSRCSTTARAGCSRAAGFRLVLPKGRRNTVMRRTVAADD